VRAELHQRGPNPDGDAAEVSFLKAVAVPRLQEARGCELRAAIGLARLWNSQGRRGEAYDLLSPLYNWFTEGFDTRDLSNAKALLDELA
jgi:predicted ATPase